MASGRGRGNPWDTPEWWFVRGEAMLVRQVIGAGATALGYANYADKKGEYYRAFFELSVGLERFAKLILVIDYALSNQGRMPDENVVRKFGHNVKELLDAVEAVEQTRAFTLRHSRPKDAVPVAIVDNLDAFADAKRGRYANFTAIGNPNDDQHEPIKRWWDEVAEQILKERYYGKPSQERIEAKARMVGAMLSGFAIVQHTTETREHMTDAETASLRTGQSGLVQKWARYHTLTVVRWLAEVHREISHSAVYNAGLDAFFGSWEYFDSYRVDNDFLKSRKVWPLD
ncbi:MAG: hypothetical protein QNJ16_10035 [Rhodobacter sp.]|nr:hypothetical protein [Rhodobacter sp.]